MTEEVKYSQLYIFVPEGQRASTETPVDVQDRWVMKLLRLCSELFGGATAYGRGVGVWRPDTGKNAKTHWDRVTVIQAWIKPELPEKEERLTRLGRKLTEMRRDLRQEEVGCILNGEWISFKERRKKLWEKI